MPLEQIFDMKKPRVLIASLAMILTFFTLACLLIRDATAPVSTTPPEAGPSYQAANEEVSSDAAEAAQMPTEQTPAAQITADQALGEQAARGPVALNRNPGKPTADQISASEQSAFKARRALETIEPRELLRRAAVPPNILK